MEVDADRKRIAALPIKKMRMSDELGDKETGRRNSNHQHRLDHQT